MKETVVVLGSGYAGAGAIRSLERALDSDVKLVWMSDVDHHLVLHESHRCIRDPAVREHVVIPVEDIKAPGTIFRQATVADIEPDERRIQFEDGDSLAYDYLLVGIGTQTAFYGIEGLEANAQTLKNLADALEIHDAVAELARVATRTDPGQVVVGGAGLTGIQVAGEIAEYRDRQSAPLDITLVEGLDNVLPESDAGLQETVAAKLADRDIAVETGSFISGVDSTTIYIGEGQTMDYDELIWTGGITGRDPARRTSLAKAERSHRIEATSTFRTSDERVFAIGDAALIQQDESPPAPPDAQAAWQAAAHAGTNIDRAIRDKELVEWSYHDKGRVMSIGEDALAHDVAGLPFVDTFDGFPARTLKKAIAVRWICHLTNNRRAVRAWPKM